MSVIDIHTHSLSKGWLELVKSKGSPDLEIGKTPGGTDRLIEYGTDSMTFHPAMFDYKQRIADMDKHGIDISIVSLTSPNVFWGSKRPVLSALLLSMETWQRLSHVIRIG